MSETRTPAQIAAGKKLAEVIEELDRAWNPDEPGIVTSFIVLSEVASFTEDGAPGGRFQFHWPYDGRTSFTTAFGLLERGRLSLRQQMREEFDDE